MKKMTRMALKGIFLISLLTVLLLTGCGAAAETLDGSTAVTEELSADTAGGSTKSAGQTAAGTKSEADTETGTTSNAETASVKQEDSTLTASELTSVSGGLMDASELFTDRDLKQEADLSGAVTIEVSDGQDVVITEEGVYVLTGTAKNVTVSVDAASDAKVQLVLDGVSITNDDFPCIYVLNADKVFVTTTDSENFLSVTGTFSADGSTNTDGVIFSKDDLVLNGVGTLTISSTDNGIVGKDDLKITGGTYVITAASKAIEANDSIRISGGTFNLTSGTDGLHAENDDDDTLGWIYICGGTFSIQAGDDGIHGTSIVEIDGGTFEIAAAEGIEGTYLQFNGGTISITASDDGINAARKSNSYYPTIEINGGNITIVMGAGDTDGIDSNGDIIVTGGTIDITGQSGFDYDGTATHTGGDITVNGQTVDTIQGQMFGGGMMGGMNGMNGGRDGSMNDGFGGGNGGMNGGFGPGRRG